MTPSSRTSVVTTPSRDDGFASLAHEARRGMGFDVETLAKLADVPTAAVLLLEQGGRVSDTVRSAVCAALAIPDGQRPQAPVSAAHAAMMLAVTKRATATGGHPVIPDHRAWAEVTGWCPGDEVTASRQAIEFAETDWSTVSSMACAVLACVTAAVTLFTPVIATNEGSPYACALEAALVGLTVSLGWATSTMVRRGGVLEAARKRAARMTTVSDHLSNRGFVLSDRGLSVVDVREKDRHVSREHQAETVYGIKVRERSTTHVDVAVMTSDGAVDMVWLRRTPALMAALHALALRPGVPWEPGFEVVPLEGRDWTTDAC